MDFAHYTADMMVCIYQSAETDEDLARSYELTVEEVRGIRNLHHEDFDSIVDEKDRVEREAWVRSDDPVPYIPPITVRPVPVHQEEPFVGYLPDEGTEITYRWDPPGR